MVLNFGIIDSGLFPPTVETGEGISAVPEVVIRNETQSSVGGNVPIGAILPWAKTLTNCPALPTNFVECNGQVLSDGDSVFNGVTMPDLNVTQRFLRGDSTSGGTGGADTHTHANGGTVQDGAGGGTAWSGGAASAAGSSLPAYYEVVFVIRVK